MDKAMTLKPRMSEKAYALSQEKTTYVFMVPVDANKYNVAAAVTAQFGVTVEEVNIANVKGKAKRTIYRSGRSKSGRESSKKKAYVTLKEGDSIPVFAAVEEADEKSEKLEKAAAKAAAKGSK